MVFCFKAAVCGGGCTKEASSLARPRQQSASSLRRLANPFTTMPNVSHSSALEPDFPNEC